MRVGVKKERGTLSPWTLCSAHLSDLFSSLLLFTQHAFSDKVTDKVIYVLRYLHLIPDGESDCSLSSLVADFLSEIWLSPLSPDHRAEDLSNSVFLSESFLDIYWSWSLPPKAQSCPHSRTPFWLSRPGVWNSNPASLCLGRQPRPCRVFPTMSLVLLPILVNEKIIIGSGYWFLSKIRDFKVLG